MNLRDLLSDLSNIQIAGLSEREITNLAYDSRNVKPGGIFVAIKGFHTDGHAYIPQAIERGAVAIVVEDWDTGRLELWHAEQARNRTGLPPTLVLVSNSRAVLAPLAAAFYGYPSRQLGMVGLTGTKGKSTTTELVSRALESGGYTTGMLSTVDFKVGNRQWPNTTRQSTPEAPEVQALLHDMVAAGCDYGVVEATSHALSERWNRLGNCAMDVAVFLNISHEHLDYHGSFEQYRRDKARLFAMLAEGASTQLGTVATPLSSKKMQKYAIVNADDPHHQFFFDASPSNALRLSYGINAPADIHAYNVTSSPNGSQMRLATPWGDAAMSLQLPGTFNIYNALAALSVALTQHVPLEQAVAALGQVRGVRGRMERIDQGQPFSVIIDYAHNPDSFTQVLSMLRPLTEGRIIAVFGSAGERDRAKRPMQGAIAARYCDVLVLTDEDPRGEDREQILHEIAAGARNEVNIRTQCYVPIEMVPDRVAAIRTALAEATPGDLVMLLGKGHEGSIEYADGKHAWDEAAEARAALRELGYSD